MSIEDKTRLYIGDLGDGITKEDVKSRFLTFGQIKQCWFKNLRRGFAFIEFHEHSDALAAMQTKGVLHIKGVKVKLDWAKPQSLSIQSLSNSNDKKPLGFGESPFPWGTDNYKKRQFIKATKEPGEKGILKVNYPEHWPVFENLWVRRPIKGKGTIENFVSSYRPVGENVEVLKVEEICNKQFYHKYETQKAFMKKKSKVNEKLLYHGSSPDIIDAICAQNFDYRLCGKHGTTYGKGSYFSTSAFLSHLYTSPNEDGVRYMFVAKVLVGNFTVGKRSYTRPPELPSSDQQELYDSCVDDVDNPRIFVVFERDQCYPKYLISYKVAPCTISTESS